MTIVYHAGQIEVQTEANTRPVAESLAERLSGRTQRSIAFYAAADLVVYATEDEAGVLRFGAVSGTSPLLRPVDTSSVALPRIAQMLRPGTQFGAIAIDLEHARRARLNGIIAVRGGQTVLETKEEFINCRKYVAPSVAVEAGEHAGPELRRVVRFDDPGLLDALATVETAFMASVSPPGRPDVSHKGGPAGFLRYHPQSRLLRWVELIGNGMFRSAGNVRATASLSVIALEIATGNAYELTGHGRYETHLRYDAPRESGLWPVEEDFPVQGVMTLEVDEVSLLHRLFLPRHRLDSAEKVTSCSPVEIQVPR